MSIAAPCSALKSLPRVAEAQARANSKAVPGPRLVMMFPSMHNLSSLYLYPINTSILYCHICIFYNTTYMYVHIILQHMYILYYKICIPYITTYVDLILQHNM